MKTKTLLIRRALFLCAFLLGLIRESLGQTPTIGIYESYIVLNINNTGNSWFDLNAITSSQDFQGADLGNFEPGVSSLVLKGGQNKTYKCHGGDVTGGNIFYRVYVTSNSSPGNFNSIGFGWSSNDGGGCGGNQTWETINNSIDILSGLNAGEYYLEVYHNATGQPATVYANNGGLNYKATFKVSSKTITSGSWSSASTWLDNIVPNSSSNVVINHDVSISSNENITISAIEIKSTKTLTQNLNSKLTLTGALTNNGTLTLENGATFIQGTSLAGSGTYNVKQTVTGAGGATPTGRFWYIGVPLNNLTRGAAFGTAGPDNRLWSWLESGQSQWSSQLPDNTLLAPTAGYVFRTGAASTTLNFSGTSLYSIDASIPNLSNSGGSFAGCHLMSNPYTAYLDWEQIFTASTNISSTYCIPTSNGSSMVYDTYNANNDVATNLTGVAMTRYIAPMQAFWAVVNSAPGSISMTKSMLSHQAGAVGLKDITSFPAFARLNLVSGDFYDQVVIYTDANATSEVEDYDSKKFFLPNKAQVYCPVGNDKLVINALKKGKAQTSAPLTVELPSTQIYTFEMSESFVENGLVVLEDKQEKIFQDMGVNPVYEFYGNSGVTADRFVLHFHLPNGTNNGGQVGNGGLAGVEDLTSGQIAVIANHDGAVTVELSADLTISGDIQIFDGAGRLVAQKAITRAQTNIQLNNGMGVYFVRVQTPMKTEMKKVMVY
jgi:hypothetical protein